MALGETHSAKPCFACLPHGPAFAVARARQAEPYAKKRSRPRAASGMEPRPKGGRVHGSRGSAIVHKGTHVVCKENRTFRIPSGGNKKKPPEGGL